jgi:hypothetical protein
LTSFSTHQSQQEKPIGQSILRQKVSIFDICQISLGQVTEPNADEITHIEVEYTATTIRTEVYISMMVKGTFLRDVSETSLHGHQTQELRRRIRW